MYQDDQDGSSKLLWNITGGNLVRSDDIFIRFANGFRNRPTVRVVWPEATFSALFATFDWYGSQHVFFLLHFDSCGIAWLSLAAVTAPSAFANNIVVILLCKRVISAVMFVSPPLTVRCLAVRFFAGCCAGCAINK